MSPGRLSLKALLARSTGRDVDLDRLLTRASGQAFVIQFTGALLAFALQWTLARLLGVERYGIYVYGLTWVRLLVLPGALGFDHATVRFVSAYNAKENWRLLRGFLIRAHQVVLVSSVVVMLMTLAVVWGIRSRLDEELLRALIVASVSLPVMSLRPLQGAGLRAFKSFVLALTARDIAPPLMVIVIALGAAAVWGELTGPAALSFHLLANALILLVTSYALIRVTPIEVMQTEALYRTGEWMRVSLPFLLLSGFFLLLKQTDILMVGTLLGRAEAGIYAVASRFAMLISFGLKSVNAIMTPLISQLHATGRMEDLQRLVSRSARMIFVFSLAACAALFVASDWALGLFGPEFRAGTPVLRLLLLSQVVNALAGSVGHLLTMTGSQRLAAQIAGSGAFLNVILNLVLIPVWGIVGAAVATALSTIGWNVAAVVGVRRRLGINPIVSWSR